MNLFAIESKLRKFFVITLILSLFAISIVATGVSVVLYNQLIQVSAELNKQATKPSETTTPGYGMQTTKIFFSKDPESYSTDFTYTVGVSREIKISSPVESSIEELLKGPSVGEAENGLKLPITLTGESNCNGDNFRVVSNLTQLGTDLEIHFCKKVTLNGAADTARIVSVVKKTILGLESSVNYSPGRIAVLDSTGNCLGDESGMNACLM